MPEIIEMQGLGSVVGGRFLEARGSLITDHEDIDTYVQTIFNLSHVPLSIALLCLSQRQTPHKEYCSYHPDELVVCAR